MLRRSASQQRSGAILPFTIIMIVVLIGFVALAVDLGMIAVARTQNQNAADAAAMAGARTLDGNSATNNNIANAIAVARQTAVNNKVLGNSILSSEVIPEAGSYTYDGSTTPPKFIGRIPKAAAEPYTLMRVRVENVSRPTAFARIFGVSSFPTSATATGVHRPRDIAIVVDFSGSMRFASLIGIPYTGTRDAGQGGRSSGSNNPESVYPKFGHYSDETTAGLRSTSDRTINGYRYDQSNVISSEAGNDNRPAIVANFYQNDAFATTKVPAFANALGSGVSPELPPNSYDTTPGGDNYLRKNNNATGAYAVNVSDILTGDPEQIVTVHAQFESQGYEYFTGQAFNGYTQGPRYWGKTFFIWPPDPRAPVGQPGDTNFVPGDWRRRFFLKSNQTSGVDNNQLLWDTSGNWLVPNDGTTIYYYINYKEIINWLKNTGPNPFPSKVRAGNIVYYSQLPDHTDLTLNTRWWSRTYNNDSERLWKEYIDHVLGVEQTGATSWSNAVEPQSGYGYDFNYGARRINEKPPTTDGRYMYYRDNPRRPRTRFWFGAMTFLDFLGNYNENRFLWPGTCHEAPLYACKLGIKAALDNIRDSHPNDYVSLIMFSVPKNASNDSSGRFNVARSPLGKNYLYAKNSLFFPQSTLKADGTSNGTEVTPYDSANREVPRAYGGTCYAMGLMLAYNQLASAPSGDTTLRRYITPTTSIPEGMVGGLGRKGAQKVVIFETDGMPNQTATPSPATPVSGSSFKYYAIRYNPSSMAGSQYPAVAGYADNDAAVTTQIYQIIDAMVAEYSLTRKPLHLHCIGFGPLFESSNANSNAAKTTLRTMQEHGNVFDGLPDYKIVTGSDSTVTTALKNAISNIVQGGVQVTLIE